MKQDVFVWLKTSQKPTGQTEVPLCVANHLLLEKVLPVAEGAKFGLFLFVLKLFVGRTKVEDQVLEGEDDPLERKCHSPRWLVLSS